MKCDICGINEATVKNYVEIHDTIEKIPSCGQCVVLNGRSVDKLLAADADKKKRLIKRWWLPERRATTLPFAYPGVDWGKVRLAK